LAPALGTACPAWRPPARPRIPGATQRVQPASHSRGSSLRGTPDGHDARPPAAARSVHLDLVAGLLAEQRPAYGRVGGHAADARDLDLEVLTVVPLELHARADRDDAARRGRRLVDDRPLLQPVPQHPNPRLDHPLLVL